MGFFFRFLKEVIVDKGPWILRGSWELTKMLGSTLKVLPRTLRHTLNPRAYETVINPAARIIMRDVTISKTAGVQLRWLGRKTITTSVAVSKFISKSVVKGQLRKVTYDLLAPVNTTVHVVRGALNTRKFFSRSSIIERGLESGIKKYVAKTTPLKLNPTLYRSTRSAIRITAGSALIYKGNELYQEGRERVNKSRLMRLPDPALFTPGTSGLNTLDPEPDIIPEVPKAIPAKPGIIPQKFMQLKKKLTSIPEVPMVRKRPGVPGS